MSALERVMVAALEGAKKVAKMSPRASAYVYDLINRQVFTDITWHERMLADRVRVEAYRKGIQGSVRPGDVVIDLGTGTGILAFMAARAGARHVYAIDHSDFIEVAKEIGRQNGFDNITFVAQNSRAFTPPEPADLLLHEQLGPAIFGENMIMNLLDLKRRALKPDGRIAPALFDLYIEPVALKDEYRVPKIWEIEGLGVDLSFLRSYTPLDKYVGKFHALQTVKNFEVDRLLGEPAPVLSIDMNRIGGEDEIERRHRVSRTVLDDGNLDAFCLYFRGRFDDGTAFDTDPRHFQTSWDNVIIRQPRRAFRRGDSLTYSIDLEDLEKPRTWEIRLA